MPTVKKDALITEITEFCARSAAAETAQLSKEPAPYRTLCSSCQLGDKTLPNRCLIAPKAMIGGCFCPNDATRRFYLERADAGILATGSLSSGKDSDPHLLRRWIPLNERLHAKGARILLQLQLDGTAKHTLTLASAGAAAGFDGICLDARVRDDDLAQIVGRPERNLAQAF